MATILNPTGLLAYGNNDPRNPVIWRSPLTSDAAIQTPEIGSATVGFNGVRSFDPVKGILPGTGSFTLSGINSYEKMSYGGQLTFQIETKMLACTNAVSEGSSGGIPQANASGTEYLLSIGNPFISSNIISIIFTNKTLQMIIAGQLNGPLLAINDAAGKGEWTDITLAWNCQTYYLYVDKDLHSSIKRPLFVDATCFAIWFGREPNVDITYNLQTAYIRNLQLSSRPPAFSVHTLLSLVQSFGDSFASAAFGQYLAAVYNMSPALVAQQPLTAAGMRIGAWDDQSYGGRTVIGTGNPAVNLQDNIPTALAKNATIVIFQAGKNDIGVTGSLNVSNFTAAMHTIIERFFGVNGNPITTVKRMVICTLPWSPTDDNGGTSTPQAFQADVALINGVFNGLIAWFNAAYPTLAGRIVLEDVFAKFGGFGNSRKAYWSTDKVHPSLLGKYIMGQAWGSGLARVLR